jgi:capsular polysaccharide biosynthesis protein
MGAMKQMDSQASLPEGYYQDEIELREIVEIIRKRIWLVVLLPLIAALVALGVSKFVIVPEYEASTRIVLGTFAHEIYGSVAASKEILLNRDLLSDVYEELNLHDQYRTVEGFAKKVSVEEVRNTRMLSVKYQDSDPMRAQSVVQAVTGRFLDLSDAVYTEKRALLEERLAELEANYKYIESTYRNSLETLEVLEAIEAKSAEVALARARTIDYLARSEASLLSVSAQIHSMETGLAALEKTRIIEQPDVGSDPVNVRPMLNTAIALVLGGMVALGLVFVMEYFEKNPLSTH